MLEGRRIVLGVTGGVAAYKAAYLARRLVERGVDLEVVMTSSSARFIGQQTFAAITGAQPTTAFFGDARVSPHTELARWAEAVVVAPCTTSTLARLANGISDDVLVATVLAATCPILVAPAMHTGMWEHPATQRNVARLRENDTIIIGPASGALAGGDQGAGRLVEPEAVVFAVEAALGPDDMKGWHVVVSAGGTREAIDPVRYVGNRSSGKMGNEIAVAALLRGAHVRLVTSGEPPDVPDLEVTRVESAEEMADAVWSDAAKSDVVVLSAAVADFRPADPSKSKLRRAAGPPQLTLEGTPDILAGVADMPDRPFLVGFAAEAGELSQAHEKARTKGVDLLVANDITDPDSGFGSDTNRVTVIQPDGEGEEWPLLTKREVADRLWDRIVATRAPGKGGS